MIPRPFVAIIGAAAAISGNSFAADPSTQPAVAFLETSPEPAPDSVDNDLADSAARPAGILKYGPVSLIDPLVKKANTRIEEFGLRFGLAYTAVFQAASGGPGERTAAGGDVDVFGDWRLLGAKGGENNGYLYFAAENRHEICTDIPPSALKGEIGSLWGTVNGFGEQDLTVKELYWQQHFGGDRLLVRIGKIDPENYYNSNYWQSDSKYFMNQAFSSFPVRAFPSSGLGMNLTAKLNEQWYISTGFQDAQGKKTEAGFDTFFEDFDLFSAFEVGFTPTIGGCGKGTCRFTAWYRDPGDRDGKPHDSGFTLSFDQRVGEHLIPFFRAGIGDGNINGIEAMISAGAGWQGALLTESDVVGLAAAWGHPTDNNLDDQFAAELFYRLQVSPDNQLTVGYQVIVNPARAEDSDAVGVFELRWRVSM